ncbi:MAG TPA: VOC family protein, partial [Agromyces mariniharenae]|nr:VOC family protein [Agromyces mariniharenae]
MPARLNPYLTFDGQAREALEFYRDVLGGTLEMTTYAEGGMSQGADDADRIMHGQLETESGFTLMASDGSPQT